MGKWFWALSSLLLVACAGGGVSVPNGGGAPEPVSAVDGINAALTAYELTDEPRLRPRNP